MLKNTYVVAYDNYMDSKSQQQKMQRDDGQEMLERFTESLSKLSKKPLQDMDRTDVVNQTSVVDRVMKNMLKYVENGMDDCVDDV